MLQWLPGMCVISQSRQHGSRAPSVLPASMPTCHRWHKNVIIHFLAEFLLMDRLAKSNLAEESGMWLFHIDKDQNSL